MNAITNAPTVACHGVAPSRRMPRYAHAGANTSGRITLSEKKNWWCPNSAAGSADASCGKTW